MELVAEGVETEVQLERMRGFGINAIQGYLFSKPLPALQLRQVIKEPIFPVLPQPRRAANALETEAATQSRVVNCVDRSRSPPRPAQLAESSRSSTAMRMNFDKRTCSKYIAFGRSSHDGSISSNRGSGW